MSEFHTISAWRRHTKFFFLKRKFKEEYLISIWTSIVCFVFLGQFVDQNIRGILSLPLFFRMNFFYGNFCRFCFCKLILINMLLTFNSSSTSRDILCKLIKKRFLYGDNGIKNTEKKSSRLFVDVANSFTFKNSIFYNNNPFTLY